MTYYANKDGSYDALNDKRVLFHLANGSCKPIGVVGDKWQHNYKAIGRLPVTYSKHVRYMTEYEVGKKM
jgi:hypothetical protein